MVAASLVDLLLDELIPLTTVVKEVRISRSSAFTLTEPCTDLKQEKNLRSMDFTGFERKLAGKNINID